MPLMYGCCPVEIAAENKCKDPGFIAEGGGVREGEVLDNEF